MAYSSAGFTDTQDNQKSFNEQFVDNDPGPYIGTVKVVNDPLKMGRLGVNIPALSLTNDPTPGQIIWSICTAPAAFPLSWLSLPAVAASILTA